MSATNEQAYYVKNLFTGARVGNAYVNSWVGFSRCLTRREAWNIANRLISENPESGFAIVRAGDDSTVWFRDVTGATWKAGPGMAPVRLS